MKPLHFGIVERQADDAAFLWTRRDRAARSPLFDLESLVEIDDRLDANLEGLILAGKSGLAAAQGALIRAENRTSDIDGEIFVTAHVAAEIGDVMALAKVLARAEKCRHGERPIVSALAWLSAGTAARVLGEMSLEASPPWLQHLALEAYAARREAPGDFLDRVLISADSSLRGRALRAVGELGRRDLLPLLRHELRTGEATALWAAWSVTLLGEDDATDRLWSLAADLGPFAEAASAMAAHASMPEVAASHLLALSRLPNGISAALAGAAVQGDPACLSWVLPILSEHAGWAHQAAWVYATITGASLSPPLAVRVPTIAPGPRDIANMSANVFRDLPSPDPGAIMAHWEREKERFPPGERFLAGRRIEARWVEECLRRGLQPWRHSAAVESMRQRRRTELFPVRAPAHLQMSRLTVAGLDR